MATSQRLDGDTCIALSIDDLLGAFYWHLGHLEDDDLTDDERGDSFYSLYIVAGEIFERFDPPAVRRELVCTYIGTEPIRDVSEIDEGSLDDLKDSLDAVERRQAARLLRDTFDGGDHHDA